MTGFQHVGCDVKGRTESSSDNPHLGKVSHGFVAFC